MSINSLRALSALLLLFPLAPGARAQLTEPADVRISVLSLFHPRVLVLSSARPLTVRLDTQTLTLSPVRPATLTCTQTGFSVNEIPTGILTLPAATFTLTVPGKLTRTYQGSLTVNSAHGILRPVLELPTELAVASIVQAESPPHASLEALKSQAVVSRSFLLAKPSPHPDADACDTTHCQFLRSPPPPESPALLATNLTRNQVLTWRATPESLPRIVPAMYSRSCGGHTRAHPTLPSAYPFYSVPCAFCLRHPERWRRPLDASATSSRSEQQRIAYNRTHGWSALPSNTHRPQGRFVTGEGIGHGIGLCQLGAADLAAHGKRYEEIVAHFFPNTTLLRLP